MDPETITTPDAIESAPITEAPAASSYQDRVAQSRAEMNDFFAEATADERAPAEPTAPTAPPSASDATGGTHGPEGAKGERPAASDEKPEARATPAETGKAPDTNAETRANNERRASAEQATLARKLADAERKLAEFERTNQTLDHDNRVLFNATERMKEIAREQGGVRFEDMDEATRAAAIEQARIRQEADATRQAAERQTAQQAEMWNREIADRTSVGDSAQKDALAAVLEAAIDAGQRITRAQAAKLLTEARADRLVMGDIALWQDPRTPGDLARQRIQMAMERNAELAIAKLTAQAVQQIDAEREPLPRYNRTHVPGESGDPVPARRDDRDRPYEERKREAMAEANDWFEKNTAQMARL